jgi:AmiR/NasT family two-component response regulator
MPRKSTAIAAEVVQIDNKAIEQLSHSANALVALTQEQNALVRATAAKLGYQLPADATDPDLIQRDIAANMRRSVEACLEVGRGLAVLKAACGHGQFLPRLEVLGIEPRVAQKFMAAASKFSNAPLTAHLTKAIGSQAKLFEMLVLDDEQIDELAELGQTGELHLDDVASMGMKELRAKLRETLADRAAGEQVRQNLSKKLTEAQVQLKRIQRAEPDQVLMDLTKEAGSLTMDALGLLRGNVRRSLVALTQYAQEHGEEPVRITMAGLVGQLQAELNVLREEFNLPDVSDAAQRQLVSEVAQWAKS